MYDKDMFEDLSGLTVREVIRLLDERIPDVRRDVPFHVCGTTTMFLHVSRDEVTGEIDGVCLDCSPLSDCYEDEDDD